MALNYSEEAVFYFKTQFVKFPVLSFWILGWTETKSAPPGLCESDPQPPNTVSAAARVTAACVMLDFNVMTSSSHDK